MSYTKFKEMMDEKLWLYIINNYSDQFKYFQDYIAEADFETLKTLFTDFLLSAPFLTMTPGSVQEDIIRFILLRVDGNTHLRNDVEAWEKFIDVWAKTAVGDSAKSTALSFQNKSKVYVEVLLNNINSLSRMTMIRNSKFSEKLSEELKVSQIKKLAELSHVDKLPESLTFNVNTKIKVLKSLKPVIAMGFARKMECLVDLNFGDIYKSRPLKEIESAVLNLNTDVDSRDIITILEWYGINEQTPSDEIFEFLISNDLGFKHLSLKHLTEKQLEQVMDLQIDYAERLQFLLFNKSATIEMFDKLSNGKLSVCNSAAIFFTEEQVVKYPHLFTPRLSIHTPISSSTLELLNETWRLEVMNMVTFTDVNHIIKRMKEDIVTFESIEYLKTRGEVLLTSLFEKVSLDEHYDEGSLLNSLQITKSLMNEYK